MANFSFFHTSIAFPSQILDIFSLHSFFINIFSFFFLHSDERTFGGNSTTTGHRNLLHTILHSIEMTFHRFSINLGRLSVTPNLKFRLLFWDWVLHSKFFSWSLALNQADPLVISAKPHAPRGSETELFDCMRKSYLAFVSGTSLGD